MTNGRRLAVRIYRVAAAGINEKRAKPRRRLAEGRPRVGCRPMLYAAVEALGSLASVAPSLCFCGFLTPNDGVRNDRVDDGVRNDRGRRGSQRQTETECGRPYIELKMDGVDTAATGVDTICGEFLLQAAAEVDNLRAKGYCLEE